MNISVRRKVAIMLVMAILTFEVQAQVEKFKAAYIYNFINYVEWPASFTGETFVIGVLGSTGVNANLQEISQKKTVRGKQIKIEIYKSFDEIGRCNILYIPASGSGKLEQAIATIGSANTLIISEKVGMLKKGSCINFIEDSDRLKFEINKANLLAKGLKYNPALEKLASNVQ
ncbi:MAG TPA: DUF4154 domain-containing protein [Bacteroidales bacterium]|nr:DUF4154 domain-containing protein [Bacteroidales bacterium]